MEFILCIECKFYFKYEKFWLLIKKKIFIESEKIHLIFHPTKTDISFMKQKRFV